MKMKRAWIILITVISALLLITGCDSRTGSEIKYKVTSINVSPRELYNDLNNQTYSTVAVTVEDNAGYPAVGVAVTFSANIGYIQGKVLTDEQGIATTNFNDDGRVGYATITAAVEGSTMIDSVNVMDSPTYDLQIKSVSEEIIYIDGGITTSTIEVQVKDQDGFAVTGEDVFFQASLGYIEYNVKTDSSGIAQTQLRDDGNILNVGTSVIHAYCGEAVADTTVSILAPPPVTNLELNIDVDPDPNMSVNTVMAVIAVAEANTPNMKALDGTEVQFTTELGYFQASPVDDTSLGKSIIATTSNGAAEVYFNSSTSSGLTTITADVLQAGNQLPAVTGDIVINPGFASQLFLDTDVTEVAVGSGEEVTVTATVLDSYNNPLNSGKRVFFTTDLGNITSPAQTNEYGIATATFSPGISAGVAEITAEVDSAYATTVVTVTSDEVNSIQFVNQDQISIDVQGTGGDETAELAVNLYDMNGNLIDYPVQVWFKFISRPEGAYSGGSNINNNVDNLTDSTYVMSSNGIAVVSVNSGITSGIIKIKASCETSDGIKKTAQKSNIIVQAGQPYDCEFTIGGYDSGDDMGGGLWKVQVAAVITDEYNNPVSNGTAVFFELGESSGGPNSGYSFATIETNNAFVGNENASGDSVAGTAYTYIIYDGAYTNEIVHVMVDVGGDEGSPSIEFGGDLKLPLQSGEITMLCVPTHVDWTEDTQNEEILYTQCRINVRDGQNNPINKQRIMFTTSLGFPTDDGENGVHPDESDANSFEFLDPEMANLDWGDLNDDNDEFDGFTGPYDGDLGRLYKDVGYYEYECPEPIPAPPGMTTGTITATIFGTTRSTNQTITLLKYVSTQGN